LDDRPVSPDTRGSIGLIVIVLAAVLYFGLPVLASGWPPAYVSVGPLSLGDRLGTCHGARMSDFVVEACK
jgi:hypothetical protein